jgi:hypothetical protein
MSSAMAQKNEHADTREHYHADRTLSEKLDAAGAFTSVREKM